VTTEVGQYRSELLRNLAAQHEEIGYARGFARGFARGVRRAVLGILEARGVAVPMSVREQIMACTDLAQLEVWLCRAVTATTVEDVIRG
jgi:hypothetical protein